MGVIGWVWNAVFAVLLCLWRWFRVLWVCRVSAVSAIGGGLLAVYTPQALDLFADTGLELREVGGLLWAALRLGVGRAYDGAARPAV